MHTFWSLIAFVGLVAVVTCIVGLIVGHLNWARMTSRGRVGGALAVAFAVFIGAAVAAGPQPTKVSNAAVVATPPSSPTSATSTPAPVAPTTSAATTATSAAPVTSDATAPQTTSAVAPAPVPTRAATTAAAPPAVHTAAAPPAAAPVPSKAATTNLCGAPANPYGYNYCGAGSYITSPASGTCSYFSCIGNFSNGKGYMDECQDGTVSMSGGRRGACSDHGGELRPVNA